MAFFRHKIFLALHSALHDDDLRYANGFIKNFDNFLSDWEKAKDWELEFALRKWYEGRKPFEWSEWDEEKPHLSKEYEDNWDWCHDREGICLFLTNIQRYIEI